MHDCAPMLHTYDFIAMLLHQSRSPFVGEGDHFKSKTISSQSDVSQLHMCMSYTVSLVAEGQGCWKQPCKEAEDQEVFSGTVPSSCPQLPKQQLAIEAEEGCSSGRVCEPFAFFVALPSSQAAQVQTAVSSKHSVDHEVIFWSKRIVIICRCSNLFLIALILSSFDQVLTHAIRLVGWPKRVVSLCLSKGSCTYSLV